MMRLCLSLLLLLFSSSSPQSLSPSQPSASSAAEISASSHSLPLRRVAHNERIHIDLSEAVVPLQQPAANTLVGIGNIADIKVWLDGEPFDAWQANGSGIVLSLPGDTALEHSHIVVESSQFRLEQNFEFVASFGSSDLVVLVEDQSEAQFRRYVESVGMQLSSFYTLLGANLSLAEVQLQSQSSQQGLQALHQLASVHQAFASTHGSASPPLWVSSPQTLYKPLRRLHSLDPSCALWPQLQQAARAWRPLFLEAQPGQADVLEALSVHRAHARGDSGRGVTVFVLDSLSAGEDSFNCADTDIHEGHGRYIVDIIRAVAPGANVVPLQVCNAAGECLSRDIANALLSLQTTLATGNPVIVTLALGAAPHPQLGVDAVIYHSLQRLQARHPNLLVVASAGNNGLDGAYQSVTARLPAGFWQAGFYDAQGTALEPLANLLSVGGIGLRAGSTLGSYAATPFNPLVPISMFAPAARLCLPHPDGGCAPDGSDVGLSGSSFAAPFVSGTAALFWEACATLSAAELRDLLLRDGNFDVSVGDTSPPVVNAYRTLPCLEASLPEAQLKLEPLYLATDQRYPLALRLETLEELQPWLAQGQWRSSNPEIASIDPNVGTGGQVAAHSAGQVSLQFYDPSSAHILAELPLTVQPQRCQDPPVIADAALAQRMEERWGSPLSCDLMAQADRLFAMELEIEDLRGLEYAPNLRWLNVSHNPIYRAGEEALEPLRALQALETLYLFGAGLTSGHLAPLADLPALQLLSLHNNAIDDLSIWQEVAFSHLQELYLYHNQLQDIAPLTQLPSLRVLSVYSNALQDIRPLAALTNLQHLRLEDNRIETIDSLAALTQLEELDIGDNRIGSVEPLAGLTALRVLELPNNQVRDLSPLASLSALNSLDLARNPIGDLQALAGLDLSLLDISRSRAADLSPLAAMHNLQILRAAFTGTQDLSPLQALQQLTHIEVAGNQNLHSLAPLASLHNLRHLDASLTGLAADGLEPLQELAALQILLLSSNELRNLEPLRTLPSLTLLDMRANRIRDLQPLVDNLALGEGSVLRLEGNALIFAAEQAYEAVQALRARGLIVEVEDLSDGLVPSHRVQLRHSQAFNLSSTAAGHRDAANVDIRRADSEQAAQWFDVFAPGDYRSTSGDNRGWMLRRAGTNLCLSANSPSPGLNITLFSCLPHDPWQQWQLQEHEDAWYITIRNNADEDFCLRATYPQARANVDLWPCEPEMLALQWQLTPTISATAD